MDPPVPAETFKRLLKREQAARKEAEKLLEAKSLELYDANSRLRALADGLDQRVRERTAELERERNNALSTTAALRASEKRFNDIAEIVGEYFWEIDPHFRFLELTAQAASVFGYPREKLMGQTLFDFMDEAEAKRLRGILEDYFQNGRPFRNILVKTLHREGHSVWQRLGGAPVFDDSDTLVRYRGAGLDVTSAEHSKSSLEVLAMALEHASEGFAITNAEGRFTYLNPAHVRIYGYSDEKELLGQPWSLLYRPSEVERLGGLIGRDLAATGAFSGEAEGLRKDGSVFPEIFSLQVLPDNGLLCMCRDDTERRRVLTNLQTQNSMRSALLDNIRTGILFEDSQAKTILTNPVICHLFAFDPEDETLRSLDCLGFFKRAQHRIADGALFFQRIHELIEQRKRVTKLEWPMLDGQFLSFDYFPVSVGKDFRGHLWSFRNITEEKAHQAILEQARASAEAGARAKSVFLANMSHEIRTPLNGIIGMNRFLMREPLTENQQEFARSVDTSAVSLLHIIDDILDFSKIEAGRIEIDAVDFYLPDVLDAVDDLLQIRADSKDIAFYLICPPTVPRWLHGDPTRLRQILLNLTSNAVKFTEKGHVCLRVKTIRSSQLGPTLEFVIEDSGIGMEAETVRRLFQPFDQGDSSISRRFGGTGLGLAISRNLADLMNGYIKVSSRPGAGSTFRVNLPFSLAQQPGEEAPLFARRSVQAVLSGGDPLQQEAIAALLEAEGLPLARTATHQAGKEAALSGSGEAAVLWILLASREESRPDWADSLAPSRLPPHVHPVWINGHHGKLPRHEVVPVIQGPTTRSTLLRRLIEILGENGADPLGDRPSAEAPESVSLRDFRILLCEDNYINQEVGRIMLENLGAAVDLADDGRAALRQVAHETYDLILMDIRMPGMDGIEASIRMRANGLQTPIIALTADAMKGDRERFLSAGMNAYLSKPLMEKDLVQSLIAIFPDLSAASPTPATMSSPETNTVFDAKILLHMLGGDTEIARSLLSEFVAQTKELLAQAEHHLRDGDLTQAASVFHRISGSAFSMHAQELAQAALDLERQLKNNPTTDWGDALLRIRAAEQRLLTLLAKVEDPFT